MLDAFDVSGKNILITGATSGIGKAAALELSKAGARLALISRNREKLDTTLQELHGFSHTVYSFDLKDIAGIENLLKLIISERGAFDGFVHCAGATQMRPIQQNTFGFIHDMMLINFYAFMELARIISKKNNHSERASFIAISSVMSKKGEKSLSAYCASKGAMDSAIRALAKELVMKNIRINGITSGYVKTRMLDEYVELAGQDEFEKNVLTNQYLGLGDPIDIAHAIQFLLSDASSFITGTSLIVDGGYLS